jgi:5-methyltetrahydrofolate corrinoid/iron sulfur protein methyltransferase
MILVGENLNIMSKSLGPALKERNADPLIEMVKAEHNSRVDYLDINIGPARKNGEEFMSWVVQTVQDVTDKPLSLDTTNLSAMESGLKVCRNKALINSISLQPDRLEKGLPLVTKYDTDMIGLLWGTEGMPRDANERAMLAVDLVYKANEAGIPNDKIWIDPIVTPVSAEINQLTALLEFMPMLSEIAPDCKSIVGLSNVSNGTPNNLRPYLNRTLLVMLQRSGLTAAIVDAFDDELIMIARGEKPEISKVIHDVMDEKIIDISKLDTELIKYAKTVQVLNAKSLYSDSWLEI